MLISTQKIYNFPKIVKNFMYLKPVNVNLTLLYSVNKYSKPQIKKFKSFNEKFQLFPLGSRVSRPTTGNCWRKLRTASENFP